MGVEAAYVVNERIKILADSIITPDVFVFKPGKFSQDDAKGLNGIATYTVIPNLDYGQPYIHVDGIHMQIFHKKFDTLSKIVSAIIVDLNSENPQAIYTTDGSGFPVSTDRSIYTMGLDDDIKFHDIVARVSKLDPKDFIEGSDFFVATVDILVQYVEL